MENILHYLILEQLFICLEPCSDKQIFFSCPQSYPGSCVNADIRCSGRSECPYGDDEQHCHRKKN